MVYPITAVFERRERLFNGDNVWALVSKLQLTTKQRGK